VVKATSRLFYPRERPGTHCIGGRVGPRAGLDGYGKSPPPPPAGIQKIQKVAAKRTLGGTNQEGIIVIGRIRISRK